MSIDGVNLNVESTVTAKASTTASAQASANTVASTLRDSLTGANRKQKEIQNETLTPNERKAWIKDYQAAHNCTKKEAKAAFDKEFGKLEMMSRKDAKNWVKAKMQETGCSKKEAKEAFKQEFGYDVPLSFVAQIARQTLIGLAPIVAVADKAAGGKLGIEKFVTGQGNNDANYQKRLT